MKTGEHTASLTGQGMPTHQHLVVSILKAVDNLGGSANTNEIAESVIENRPNAEEIRQSTYPPTTPRYRLPINVTEPLERNLSTAIRAVFAANAYTLLGDTLNECARSGLFGNKETNPDAFHDRRKTTAEFFTHSASRVFTGLFKNQTHENDDITVPDFLNRDELDAIATRLHVCAHQWIATIQPETTTPQGPQERNNLDSVLARFPNDKEDLAPGAQESFDFLASLELDGETPTGYQAVDSADDNRFENEAPELEAEHVGNQDAEL